MPRMPCIIFLGFVAAFSVARGPATAASLAEQRLQSIAAAKATLRRDESLAWRDVIHGDQEELAYLHKASITAMRAGNARAVVVIQKLINAATRQLSVDDSGPPFPPGFNTLADTQAINPIMAGANKRRNALLHAAEAKLAEAHRTFREAVLAADRHVIAQLHVRVNAAMKALDANAVVADMHRLRLAKAQLRADLPSQSESVPHGNSSDLFGQYLTAQRVVFLLDHSGASVGRLYLLRAILQRAIEGLSPSQRFAVIVFAGKYRILVANRLLQATRKNKDLVIAQLKNTTAEGRSEGMLVPFLRPIQAAWAMQAQAVLLLTDVPFDPRLVDRIGALNKQRHVAVYTVGSGGSRFEAMLRKISQETGGSFFNPSMGAVEKWEHGIQPDSRGAVPLFEPGRQTGPGSPVGIGPGRRPGPSGSVVVPPPNPIMPLKYQSAWPANLVNPEFQLTVRRNGTVARVKVLTSTGHAGVDQAIINALMQARFLPNIVRGKPVQSRFVIRYQLKP